MSSIAWVTMLIEVKWSAQYTERRWAIGDCRALSRRLEADLLAAGERVVRVPPKLMAGVRRSARTRGKSDPIDTLAVARAALREPGLPVARFDGPAREVRLLVDYRESLVKDRTAAQNRLRWRLHELEPGYDPPAGSLNRYKTLDAIDELLDDHSGVVADVARREVSRIRELTREANQLEADISTRVTELAPSLMAIPGCGALSAAKLVGEAAPFIVERRFVTLSRHIRDTSRHMTFLGIFAIHARHGDRSKTDVDMGADPLTRVRDLAAPGSGWGRGSQRVGPGGCPRQTLRF